VRLVYANCYVGDLDEEDILVTDEPSVLMAARRAGAVARLCDTSIDPDEGQAWNTRVWSLAFQWPQILECGDPTLVGGISAGDIAGGETVQRVLMPAVRAALSFRAAVEETKPEAVVAASGRQASRAFQRAEDLQCDVVETVARRAGIPIQPRIASADPRNRRLVRKYARGRDNNFLASGLSRRTETAGQILATLVNATATLRRRGADRLLVLEYNPTRSFAQRYVRRRQRSHALIRCWPPRREVPLAALMGDLLLPPPRRPRSYKHAQVRERTRDALRAEGGKLDELLMPGGAALLPLLEPLLVDGAERYAAFVASTGPQFRRMLERLRPTAVLVPYDTPPHARLLVRTAQSEGIPTLVMNNGVLVDDFQQECMTADYGLSWSTSIAARYFSRRCHGQTFVTGNPRADSLRACSGTKDAVLVGSHTVSWADLNSHRSDPESFLDAVLEGIGRSSWNAADVLIKLHPSDPVDHYQEVLALYRHLRIHLVTKGDVADLFHRAAVYVSTYSTSLLEAAANGLPVIYFYLGAQRIHPPFGRDLFLDSWRADSPEQLAERLDAVAEQRPTAEQLATFAATYLGPADGQSVDRIMAAVRQVTRVGRSDGDLRDVRRID